MKKKIRQFIVAVTLLAFVFVLATACSSTPQQPAVSVPATEQPAAAVEEPAVAEEAEEAPVEEAEEAAEPEAQEEVVLTVSIPRDADRLDPQRTTLGTSGFLSNLIYDPLIAKDPETGEFYPWLAESFNRSEDGLVWTFELREGVTFHDGTPLNADAVVATIERLLDPDTQSPFTNFMGEPNVTKIDEMTVEIAYDEYWATFEDLMVWSGDKLGILSPAAIEANGLDYGLNPVGTGPFMFAEWVEGDHITLVKNTDYNMPAEPFYEVGGPAKVDRIVFQILPDAQVRLEAQRGGQTQVMLHDILPKDILTLQDDPNQVVHSFNAVSVYYVGLNVEKEPTTDPAVRQALSMAVDRQLIADTIMSGQVVPAYGYLVPALAGLGYDSDGLLSELDLDYDPEKAGQLLEEAGWVAGADGVRVKDGQPLELELWVQNISPRKEIGEIIQSMAAEVGIRVNLVPMESSAFWNSLSEGGMNAWFGDGQMPAPDFLSFHFDSSRIPATNRYRYNNPAVDELLQAGRTNPDAAARDQAYKEVQRIIFGDAAGIPMFFPLTTDVYSTAVENFQVHTGHQEYPLWVDLTLNQ